MTDDSSELALLTARTSDLLSQMMLAEAQNELEVGHFMVSFMASLSAWKELLLVPAGAYHSMTRSS